MTACAVCGERAERREVVPELVRDDDGVVQEEEGARWVCTAHADPGAAAVRVRPRALPWTRAALPCGHVRAFGGTNRVLTAVLAVLVAGRIVVPFK